MNKEKIIEKVQALNLPKDAYIVFGSCPLAAAGLRLANDIDMLVNQEVFEALQAQGWVPVDKVKKDKPLTYDVFEAHTNWDFSSYSPTLKALLETADYFDGIPFASLEEVRKWKLASGRPKDIQDIKLLDNYLAERKF